jgi:hypothetical protein
MNLIEFHKDLKTTASFEWAVKERQSKRDICPDTEGTWYNCCAFLMCVSWIELEDQFLVAFCSGKNTVNSRRYCLENTIFNFFQKRLLLLISFGTSPHCNRFHLTLLFYLN